MPYTHGLPGSIVCSLIFGGIVAWFMPANRGRTALLVAAASFSHWILDLIVHRPDLPLYDNSAKVGFGLWQHVAVSFPLELIVLGVGAWLYARTITFKRPFLFWGFVIFLAAMQVYANFGPPPASTDGMAIMALGFYAALALLVAMVERFAVGSTN
jgi:hypothetical protein